MDDDLAGKVATQLMEHDAIGTHLRDELGITETSIAQPLQAAVASAAAFAVGAALPVIIVALVPLEHISTVVVVSALLLLVLLGALAARLGGAPIVKGAVRVAFWGATAMGLTFLVGRIFGTTV